jgi:hypothetical protein
MAPASPLPARQPPERAARRARILAGFMLLRAAVRRKVKKMRARAAGEGRVGRALPRVGAGAAVARLKPRGLRAAGAAAVAPRWK